MSWLVFSLLFLLPFIVLPFGTSYFETPKVVLAELGIVVLLLVSFTKLRLVISSPNRISIILFLVLGMLSLIHLFFFPTTLTFLGNAFRHQGVFLLWLLLLFALCSSQIKFFPIPLWVLTLIACGEFVAALFIGGTSDGRAVGTLGEPNALGSFAVFILAWATSLVKKRPVSIVLFALTFFVCVGILLLSGSRSSIIALLIGGVFFLFYNVFRLSLRVTTVACLLLFFASLSLPFFQYDVVYENRAEIWHAALLAGYEHPITGWGFGNSEVALREYNHKLFNRLQGYYVDSSHNIFLDWWIQGGFVGLACLVGFLYGAVRTFVTTNQIRETVLLICLLVSLSFNPVSVVTLIAFWWIVGQSITHTT